MTDNEKRAHDYAIAMLPLVYHNAVRELDVTIGECEHIEVDIDFYDDYIEIYESTLTRLNK